MNMNYLAAAAEPTSLRLCASAEFQMIEAEAGEGKPKLKRFSIIGYTGGMMQPEGWSVPVVLNLDGLAVPRQTVPALMSHNHASIVGHTDSIEKSQQRLKFAGVFSAFSDTEQTTGAQSAREIVRLAGNGFDWQASVGAQIHERRFVAAGDSAKVNGRNFDGPFVLIEKSTLAEISFVAIGADMNTTASVAATGATDKGSNMNPEFLTWLKANEYTEAEIGTLAGKKLSTLQAAWESSKAPAAGRTPTQFEQELANVDAENERIEHLQRITVEACHRNVGNSIKCKQFRDLCASALTDRAVTRSKFELEMMRLERTHEGINGNRAPEKMTNDVIEAALCLSQKLPNPEKHFSHQTLEAASTGRFKKGIGLGEVIFIAAESNGNYRGSPRDVKPLLEAAYGGRRFEAAGPSTIDISGILSNVANKFLRPAFESVEMEWKKIVIVKPVTDFKEIKSYSLVGDNVYEELSPSGKIKDGSLGNTTYTNRAKSFGKLLGLSYQDIRNDDLGALTGIAKRLGRGGALKMNTVIWQEWLNDSAFFPTDKSLANYDDGATDSVLSLAGLANGDTIFRAQTNPRASGDSETSPLGSIPKILLVPIPLRTTGWNLMNSQFVNLVTATTPTQGTANPWQGQFLLVASSYLGAGNTNGSDTAWYLLADPQDICGLEVVVLDGQEMPQIEFGDPDFDELGIKARGTHHFGAAKQEPKCGVKLKGAV